MLNWIAKESILCSIIDFTEYKVALLKLLLLILLENCAFHCVGEPGELVLTFAAFTIDQDQVFCTDFSLLNS